MKTILYLILMISFLIQCTGPGTGESAPAEIRMNQIGFLPQSKKTAVITFPSSSALPVVIHNSTGRKVFEGSLSPAKKWRPSNETVSLVDFSEINTPGSYRLSYGNLTSPVFRIGDSVYTDLIKAATKYYYFNRASTQLNQTHAGSYQRPLSHPDTAVYIHPSASGKGRPQDHQISTPRGWYDAGDFNKYIVNSGITTYTLLISYLHHRSLFDSLNLIIPESDNQKSDLLDEILWNVKWIETMQDPVDGGVYHKTTTARFEGFVTADQARSKRYVVAKGTAASLDFSAVLAKVSTVLKETDTSYAKRLLNKAEKAWEWARNHPNQVFKNPSSDTPGYPSVVTGEYGDESFEDEFFWATTELYLATGKQRYKQLINMGPIAGFSVPDWKTVGTLGMISLASSDQALADPFKGQTAKRLKSVADSLVSKWRNSPYQITIDAFRWGSNSDVLNQGMVLMCAYRLFQEPVYLNTATSCLDYVLGRNATGYCFVTGFGSKSPMLPHHRQSASDEIKAPVPGMLVGGPNPNQVDKDCGKDAYPSLFPATCYNDIVCSYSTNEVAINWNAPLVYMAASIETHLRDPGLDKISFSGQ